MKVVKHLTRPELEAGLDEIRQSPRSKGVLELIVRRPGIGEREVVGQGELDLVKGLVGDNWSTRGNSRTTDGAPHPEKQLTIMNARVMALLAPDKRDWGLSGDQLYVDMDLSGENLSPGAQLAVGSAVIEVTALPHTGCKKFAARFGSDAARWVNSPIGKQLHLRGINAKIVRSGVIQIGEAMTRA